MLIFPSELRVADAAINTFVERAMRICATGNYEEFRLLWSAQRDPLPRDEFEQGWQAVRTIRVRALQRIILGSKAEPDLTDGEEAYVLLTDIELDPKHPAGQEKPNREAALLVIRERDDWRLTKAPKQVREWVKDHFSPSPESTPTSAPQPKASGDR